MTSPKRALMIQLRRIGDVLMCTPSIRAFNQKFPDCRLDFLTELPEVLRGNSNLNSIIDVDRGKQYHPIYQFKLINSLRKSNYDMVIDFFANPRSAYYSFLSGAQTRLSYGFGHRKWAYNLTPVKESNSVYAAQDRLNLMRAIGIESTDCKLDFHVSEDNRREAGNILAKIDNKKFVTLSPVSRRDFNRWPLERYAELGQLLSAELGYAIIVLTGPGEEHVGDKMNDLMQVSHPLIVKAKSLGVLGAIFEKAELHIGNDNGPKHIAVAAGIPTFTIYGPHSHISWTYPDPKFHAYIRPADVDSECRQPNHKCNSSCISKIPVDAVWDKIREFDRELISYRSSVRTG